MGCSNINSLWSDRLSVDSDTPQLITHSIVVDGNSSSNVVIDWVSLWQSTVDGWESQLPVSGPGLEVPLALAQPLASYS
jgi:hypothetical protein